MNANEMQCMYLLLNTGRTIPHSSLRHRSIGNLIGTTATAADELHDNIIIIYDRGELRIFKSVSTKNKS